MGILRSLTILANFYPSFRSLLIIYSYSNPLAIILLGHNLASENFLWQVVHSSIKTYRLHIVHTAEFQYFIGLLNIYFLVNDSLNDNILNILLGGYLQYHERLRNVSILTELNMKSANGWQLKWNWKARLGGYRPTSGAVKIKDVHI